MAADGLTVVIPTEGRCGLLAALLESVDRDRRSCRFSVEIIIVDSSEGADRARIEALARAVGARICSAPGHVGKKRNEGIRRARFDRILFLDSDVTVRPGLLAAHYRVLESADGCAGLVVFTGRSTLAWRIVEATQLMLPFSYPNICEFVPWGPAANISFASKALNRIGGFDERLPRFGGEDVDIGFRLTDAGYRIATSRDAVAEHTTATWASWSANTKRLFAYGRADYYLLLRHRGRSYVDPWSPLPWFTALCALAVVGGRSPAIVIPALGIAYFVSYAAVRRHMSAGFFAQALSPLVWLTMDAGKSLEAIRHGRPDLLFRRVKYLDDITFHDRFEIRAARIALVSACLAFAAVLLGGICHRRVRVCEVN